MIENIAFLTFVQLFFVSVHGGGFGVQVYGKKNVIAKHPLITKLENDQNILFHGHIWVGTPREGESRQKFKVSFDSGSTDLIVLKNGFQRKCPEDEPDKTNCKNAKHESFDPSASTTYEPTEGAFSITYLDGSGYTGHVVHEYIELGEGDSKVRVKTAIAVADLVINDMNDVDGMIGMGFGIGSNIEPQTVAPLESIFTQTDIPKQLGYYITKDENHGGFGGEIYFGGYNPNYVESSGFTVPVPCISNGGVVYSWHMTVKSVKVGDNLISLQWEDDEGNTVDGFKAIPDTGTVDLAIGESILDEIAKYFPGTQWNIKQIVSLCADVPDNLPDITLIVNDEVQLTLGPEDYIYSEVGGLVCRSSFQPVDHNGIILGNVFLQKYYTVFDYEKKEMKFALAKRKSVISATSRKQRGIRLSQRFSGPKLRELRIKLKQNIIPGFAYTN